MDCSFFDDTAQLNSYIPYFRTFHHGAFTIQHFIPRRTGLSLSGLDCVNTYSDRNDLTGLVIAALIAWEITVMTARRTVINPAIAYMVQLIFAR